MNFRKINVIIFVLVMLTSCRGDVKNMTGDKGNKVRSEVRPNKSQTANKDLATIGDTWTKKTGGFGIYYRKGKQAILKNFIDEKKKNLDDLVEEALEGLAFYDLENFDGSEKITKGKEKISDKKIPQEFEGKKVYDLVITGMKQIYMKLIVQKDSSYLTIVSDEKALVEKTYHEIYQR